MFDRTTHNAPLPEPAATIRELRLAYELAVGRGWERQAAGLLVLMEQALRPRAAEPVAGEEAASC